MHNILKEEEVESLLFKFSKEEGNPEERLEELEQTILKNEKHIH